MGRNDNDCSRLACALTANKQIGLERLDLSLNPLGNEGIANIASAMLRSTVPSELIIQGCQFCCQTANVLAAMLKHTTYLRELDISNNQITDEAGEVI